MTAGSTSNNCVSRHVRLAAVRVDYWGGNVEITTIRPPNVWCLIEYWKQHFNCKCVSYQLMYKIRQILDKCRDLHNHTQCQTDHLITYWKSGCNFSSCQHPAAVRSICSVAPDRLSSLILSWSQFFLACYHRPIRGLSIAFPLIPNLLGVIGNLWSWTNFW